MGEQNHRESGGRMSPSRVQERSPGRGSGGLVSQKLKNFLSSYKQILRIFGSISQIFTYICLRFFRACRHHSTKSNY